MKKKIAGIVLCMLIVACGWNVTINEWNQAGRMDSEYTEKNSNARAQSSDGQTVTLEDISPQTEQSIEYDEQGIETENENITEQSADTSKQHENEDGETGSDYKIKTDVSASVADTITEHNTAVDNKTTEKQTEDSRIEGIAAEETVTEEDPVEYKTGYIFLGDSRFYLLNEQCHIEDIPNFFVVSCPSMGYAWLVDTAFPRVQNLQKQHTEIENWVVICGLGVNDLTSIRSYLNKYQKWPETSKLYLLSVNPTKAGAPARCNNQRIEAFNSRLKKVKNATYIDCYHYLTKLGYGTKGDGVHYDESTNWAIYSYILEQLNRKAGGDPVNETECKPKAKKLEEQLSQKKY